MAESLHTVQAGTRTMFTTNMKLFMPYMTDGDIHILAAVTSGHTEMATAIIMFSYAQNIHSIHTTKVPQTHNHGVKTESGSNCLKR